MQFCVDNVHSLGSRPAVGLKDPSLLCFGDAGLLGLLSFELVTLFCHVWFSMQTGEQLKLTSWVTRVQNLSDFLLTLIKRRTIARSPLGADSRSAHYASSRCLLLSWSWKWLCQRRCCRVCCSLPNSTRGLLFDLSQYHKKSLVCKKNEGARIISDSCDISEFG